MTISRTILLILSIATISTVLANNYKNPPVRTDTYDQAITITAGAEVLDIIDGDTIRVSAHMWPNQKWEGNIRLSGIDTPEIGKSQCQDEKEQGIMARDTLRSLIPPRVLLLNIEKGKFDIMAKVMDGTHDMADILMENAVGRSYDGKKKRKTWCPESERSIRERHDIMKPIHHTDTPESKKSKKYLNDLHDSI